MHVYMSIKIRIDRYICLYVYIYIYIYMTKHQTGRAPETARVPTAGRGGTAPPHGV